MSGLNSIGFDKKGSHVHDLLSSDNHYVLLEITYICCFMKKESRRITDITIIFITTRVFCRTCLQYSPREWALEDMNVTRTRGPSSFLNDSPWTLTGVVPVQSVLTEISDENPATEIHIKMYTWDQKD